MPTQDSTSSESNQPKKTKKIFLLEDQEIRIKRFKQELIGYSLTIATSIEEALERWNPPYDLVFLDHDLGQREMVDTRDKNTGSEFARQKYEDLKKERVIIHSGNYNGAKNINSYLSGQGMAFQYSLDWDWDIIRDIINN